MCSNPIQANTINRSRYTGFNPIDLELNLNYSLQNCWKWPSEPSHIHLCVGCVKCHTEHKWLAFFICVFKLVVAILLVFESTAKANYIIIIIIIFDKLCSSRLSGKVAEEEEDRTTCEVVVNKYLIVAYCTSMQT